MIRLARTPCGTSASKLQSRTQNDASCVGAAFADPAQSAAPSAIAFADEAMPQDTRVQSRGALPVLSNRLAKAARNHIRFDLAPGEMIGSADQPRHHPAIAAGPAFDDRSSRGHDRATPPPDPVAGLVGTSPPSFRAAIATAPASGLRLALGLAGSFLVGASLLATDFANAQMRPSGKTLDGEQSFLVEPLDRQPEANRSGTASRVGVDRAFVTQARDFLRSGRSFAPGAGPLVTAAVQEERDDRHATLFATSGWGASIPDDAHALRVPSPAAGARWLAATPLADQDRSERRSSTQLPVGAHFSPALIDRASLALMPHAFAPRLAGRPVAPLQPSTGIKNAHTPNTFTTITSPKHPTTSRAPSDHAGNASPAAADTPRRIASRPDALPAPFPNEPVDMTDTDALRIAAIEPVMNAHEVTSEARGIGSATPVSLDILPPPRPAWLPGGHADRSDPGRKGSPVAALAPAQESATGFRAVRANAPGVFGSVAIGMHHVADRAQWERVLAEDATRFFTTGCAVGEQICNLPNWQRWQAIYRQARKLGKRERIAFVNQEVNRLVRYVDDRTLYGKTDHWARLEETVRHGAGDCEDYAIAKMWLLKALGIPAKSLQLVALRDTRRGLDHAVLAVHLENDILILDNVRDRALSHQQLAHYQPLYSFAQEASFVHGFRRDSGQQLAQRNDGVAVR